MMYYEIKEVEQLPGSDFWVVDQKEICQNHE